MEIIEWQLPVSDDLLNGTGFKIHGNAKIHCFCNGSSLCFSKYWLIPQYWETTDYGEKDIETHSEYFCKECVAKFKKMKRKMIDFNGGYMEKLDKLSVFISLILRHKPDVAGIALDEHGWANVDELINGINNTGRKIDMEVLEEIIRTDNKQRYSFNEDKTQIRANQGHSIPVDVELKE